MQTPPGLPPTHYIPHKRDQFLIFLLLLPTLLHLVPLSPTLPSPLPPFLPPFYPESPEDELGAGEEDRAFNDTFAWSFRSTQLA